MADLETANNVFVYGTEVADFRNVDFNQITALNVSATQELAKRVADLEDQNAELTKANETLKTQYEAQLQTILQRLQTLENNEMKANR